MFSDLNLTLEYINLELEKSDLDQPLVKLNYSLQTEFNNKRTTDLYLNIESIKYDITLQSSDSNSSTLVTELRIGEFHSPNPIIEQVGMHTPIFFYFILPTKALGKILDIMMKGRVIVLKIFTEIYYKIYQFQNSIYILKDISKKTEYIKDDGRSTIILPNQDTQKLIKDSEYTQKLRIDISLYNYNSTINPSIKGASSSLQSASKELEKGNFHGTLINTRNAVTNHLTEIIVVKEEDGNKRRILKRQLRNDLLARAPTDAYNIYEKAIDSLQNELLSALDIIHKFVHEDSDRIKMMPMHEDLELAYFSVALITSYLARRLST